MNEEWRPIEGYEGLYYISNTGRVSMLKMVIVVTGYIKVKC